MKVIVDLQNRQIFLLAQTNASVSVIMCIIKEVVATNADEKQSLRNKVSSFCWPQYLGDISTDQFKLFHLLFKENHFSLQR